MQKKVQLLFVLSAKTEIKVVRDNCGDYARHKVVCVNNMNLTNIHDCLLIIGSLVVNNFQQNLTFSQ